VVSSNDIIVQGRHGFIEVSFLNTKAQTKIMCLLMKFPKANDIIAKVIKVKCLMDLP
jgi:hypothetical protein